MKRHFATACAWAFLALIALWTLGPLSDRPQLGHPQLERFGAYCVLGALFSYAYRRPALVAAGLALTAVALEFGQLLAPGRDAGAPDAAAKVLGAVFGVMLVAGVRSARQGRARR